MTGIDLTAEDIAGIACAQDAAFALARAACDEIGLEDDDPHGEIVRPVDEDEVDLELFVMMGSDLAELPTGHEGEAFRARSDFELFLHGDKK